MHRTTSAALIPPLPLPWHGTTPPGAVLPAVCAAAPVSPSHALPVSPRSSVRKLPLYSACGTKDFRPPHIPSTERANTPSFLQGCIRPAVAPRSRTKVSRQACCLLAALSCPYWTIGSSLQECPSPHTV